MAKQISKITWSPLAERQYLKIKDYLLEEFSQKELVKFNVMLQKFEVVVAKFPEIYQETTFKKNLRRAKRTTAKTCSARLIFGVFSRKPLF